MYNEIFLNYLNNLFDKSQNNEHDIERASFNKRLINEINLN